MLYFTSKSKELFTTQSVTNLYIFGYLLYKLVFEAALKGYNIDTSDFVINTSHDIRSREGNLNMWLSLKKIIFIFIDLDINKYRFIYLNLIKLN